MGNTLKRSRHQIANQVIVLSQFMFPESNATGHLLTTLAVGLVRKGVTAKAYCARPSYYGPSDVPRILDHQGVVIRRLWSTQFGRVGMLGRITDAVTFLASAMVQMLRFPRHSVILVVTNPPLLPLVGALRKLVFGNPFVVVVHDVYPEIAVRLGALKSNGIGHRLLKVCDSLTLAHADAVVVLGRDMRDELARKMRSRHSERVHVIPNWADSKQISPMPKQTSSIIQREGLADKFVVQYSGNLGWAQGIEILLEAACLLRDENVTFMLVGEGQELPRLKSLATTRHLINVVFLPRAEWSTLSDSLAACDVAVVPLRQGVEGLSVPSKYYGVLASARPVIAIMPSTAEVARSVTENRCGLVSPPGDPNALAAAIRTLKSNPALALEFGRNARIAFDALYTSEHGIAAYYALLSRFWNTVPLGSVDNG
jgi:glycosyltransferase involved in cell wall biosynthesis